MSICTRFPTLAFQLLFHPKSSLTTKSSAVLPTQPNWEITYSGNTKSGAVNWILGVVGGKVTSLGMWEY